MKKIQGRYQIGLVFVVLVCMASTCKIVANQNLGVEKVSSVKNTQALILVQDINYDVNNKDTIVSPYETQKVLHIPTDLAPQNKWIMFEGPVLENDQVAYRYYADSRHRFDIYGKTVSDLVMDTVSWDYHNIMDWGSDILKVGNSLGLGSPAIWYQDSLYTLSTCKEKVIEVIENGNDRSMIRTTFTALDIDGYKFDLIQDWSIVSGKPWSEINLKVINGSLPDKMRFATGIVKHLPEIIQGESQNTFYALNWGKQSYHNENMGMAIIADKSYAPVHVDDELSHAFAFNNADNEVTYRFLAAWERDSNNVQNSIDFKALVELCIH